MSVADCIFCKIVEGKIPSRKVYEDDEILAFHDINPMAPVHFMIIPKQHVDSLATCGPEHAPVLGRIMAIAGRLAREIVPVPDDAPPTRCDALQTKLVSPLRAMLVW